MSNKKTYIENGNTIRVQDATTVNAFDHLPAKTYTVKRDEQSSEFFLEEIDPFTLPSKIYGKNPDHATRILNTFESRPAQTGVLLSGIKGAGKTLLAKQVSVLGQQRGYPTIVINKDWHGDEFNSFIQSINTPTIIVFDEFEKIYSYNEQRKILTLFDGVFNSRKLFLVTTNDVQNVSEYMSNRPGRMYYKFAFDTLEQDFIQEFLEDQLKDKSRIDEVLKYTNVFSFFNFDMLSAAVEEMNRYGESLAQVLEVLNIQPENKSSDTYQINLVVLNKTFSLDRAYTYFQPNNFVYDFYLDDSMSDTIKNDQEVYDALCKNSSGGVKSVPDNTSWDSLVNDESYITFAANNIIAFDQVENKFIYNVCHNNHDVELHVTRNDPVKTWRYNHSAF